MKNQITPDLNKRIKLKYPLKKVHTKESEAILTDGFFITPFQILQHTKTVIKAI